MKGVISFFLELAGLFKDAYAEWKKDNASLLAAALAYYAIFSLAPLVIIVLALAGVFFGPHASEGIIEERVSVFLGYEFAHLLQEIVRNAGNPSASAFATTAALVFLFFGATGLFMQIKKGLDIIWDAEPRETTVINVVSSYTMSFIQIVAASLVMVLSTLLTAVLSSASRHFGSLLRIDYGMLHLVNFVVFFVTVYTLFASTYKHLSGVSLQWSDVSYGSGFAALFFVVGNMLIQIYTSAADLGSVYGAASSLIVVLFWVYYSAQIFLLGAEYIKVYARKHGSLRRGLDY